MKQRTLKRCYSFEGKGLHTGRFASMTLKPAPEDTGIVFRRLDISRHATIQATAENISNTDRSTCLTQNDFTVKTVEHVLSALTGLGVDNAIIDIDNIEVPILDGSARKYSLLIGRDGLEEQQAERHYIDLPKEIEVRDEQSGSWIRLTPASTPSYDLTIDFPSKVIGVQKAHWDPSIDYISEIGPCRTFVFFHEIEYLFKNNLIKGGDADNAIVVVEHPVSQTQLDALSQLFDKPKLEIRQGYLDNIHLHFPNECCRHKLLDLIGDLRLAGGFVRANITAYKSGHTINSKASQAIREAILNP